MERLDFMKFRAGLVHRLRVTEEDSKIATSPRAPACAVEKGLGTLQASSGFHGSCCRRMALSIISNLRRQAVSVTLGFLPTACKRAENPRSTGLRRAATKAHI